MSRESDLIFFLGPTCSRKSYWAYELGEPAKTPVINADSVQVYKYTNIGTAKPSEEQMKSFPHFLFDFVEPPEKYTAGKYFKDSRKVIEGLSDQERAFIVGGSGFYLQALEKGMYDTPQVSEEIEKEIFQLQTSKGVDGLLEKLKGLDPEHVLQIDPKDLYRIKRALELVMVNKKTMKEIQEDFAKNESQQRIKNKIVKIGFWPEKDWLLNQVKERTRAMIQIGLLDEVKDLLNRNLKDWSPLKSVGYAETIEYVNGTLNSEDWRESIVSNTMYLAKRQKTWFKRDDSIQWFDPSKDENSLKSEIENYMDKKKGE